METEESIGRFARLWRWFTLATVTPEADPVRTLSSATVAFSTAVLSYSTLRDLGVAIGLAVFASYLFPLAFDAAVLAATRVWLHPALSKGTRRYGMFVAVFTIAASIIGNSLQHWRSGVKAGDPTWWTVTVISFSALMPFVLGLVMHLVAMVGNDVRKRKADEETKAAKSRARAAAPAVPATVAVQREAVAEVAPVIEQQATGTDGAPMPTATVTPIGVTGSPKERIKAVRKALLADGKTIAHVSRGLPLGPGGADDDVPFAQVDAKAHTNGYAKRVVPALEKEEAQEVSSGQADEEGQQ